MVDAGEDVCKVDPGGTRGTHPRLELSIVHGATVGLYMPLS